MEYDLSDLARRADHWFTHLRQRMVIWAVVGVAIVAATLVLARAYPPPDYEGWEGVVILLGLGGALVIACIALFPPSPRVAIKLDLTDSVLRARLISGEEVVVNLSDAQVTLLFGDTRRSSPRDPWKMIPGGQALGSAGAAGASTLGRLLVPNPPGPYWLIVGGPSSFVATIPASAGPPILAAGLQAGLEASRVRGTLPGTAGVYATLTSLRRGPPPPGSVPVPELQWPAVPRSPPRSEV